MRDDLYDLSAVSPVPEQKYGMETLDRSSMCIDGPESLLPNGPITKVHYGRHNATNKQREIRGDVDLSKAVLEFPLGNTPPVKARV